MLDGVKHIIENRNIRCLIVIQETCDTAHTAFFNLSFWLGFFQAVKTMTEAVNISLLVALTTIRLALR